MKNLYNNIMENRYKNLVFRNENTSYTVDSEGCVTDEVRKIDTLQTQVSTEPDFIKLYLTDIARLNDLPKGANQILLQFLKLMVYDNTFTINSYHKKNIAEKLNTTIATINNTLTKLTQEGVITRISSGVYMFNPYLFGKGKWKDINALRVTIKYDGNGRHFQLEKMYNEEDLNIYKVAGINEAPKMIQPIKLQ